MVPDLSSSKSNPETRPAPPMYGERFTHRLEAFSDLVFGFSLSLLATRLDVPANLSEVFDRTRWGTFIVTFAMICVIWLAHYRIFRHRFIARTPDVIVNFVFLFGIAVLPYSVQTFLRYPAGRDAVILYFDDFALIFAALVALRWSALRQRRGDDDVEVRVREWRGIARQSIIVLIIVGFLLAAKIGAVPIEKILPVFGVVLILVTLLTRLTVHHLPKFLE